MGRVPTAPLVFAFHFLLPALAVSSMGKWDVKESPEKTVCFKKLWYICTMEFYTAERKKELIPFATAWMELESIMLSEISQTVRDKYHMISPLTGT